MRKIGTLSTSSQAERFHQYLESKGIQNKVDQVGQIWDVWIYEEEQLASGREEFQQFTAAPEDPQYRVIAPVRKPAAPVAPVKAKRPQGSERLQLTIIITALSLAMSLGSNFGKEAALTTDILMAPPGGNLSLILRGEIWRLYTPMFLHLSPLHLGVNVYMFWILGGAIERTRGLRTLLFLILLIAPVSHLTQYFLAGPAFGGLSGVVYGLVGFLWMRSVLLPDDGYYIPDSIVFQLIIWALLGVTGVIGNMANGAHFGGLFAGMVIGAFPRLWRR